MRKISFFIFLTFFLIDCKNKNYAEKKSNGVSIDSSAIVSEEVHHTDVDTGEKLEVHDSIFDLVATKRETDVKNIGEVCLKYKFKGDTDYSNYCFKYGEFSEVIFPDTSIAIVNKTGYRTSNYYLFKDKKLLIPLIGTNFLLIYVVDLKNQQVMQERRTYLDFLWLNENTETLFTADSPQMKDDQMSVYYNIFVYKIKNQELDLIKRDRINFKLKENQNRNLTYVNAKRILRD